MRVKNNHILELFFFFRGRNLITIVKIMKGNYIQKILNTHFMVIFYNEFVRNIILKCLKIKFKYFNWPYIKVCC